MQELKILNFFLKAIIVFKYQEYVVVSALSYPGL